MNHLLATADALRGRFVPTDCLTLACVDGSKYTLIMCQESPNFRIQITVNAIRPFGFK